MTSAGLDGNRAVDELARRHPHGAALARYASLAVRIEPALMRRLRLRLLPAADAGAEAALWFSDLVESRGTAGLVLIPEVLEYLRGLLVAEELPDGRLAIDAAWATIDELHRDWPASLRLEERITYLALTKGAAGTSMIDEVMRPAVVAMSSGEQRAVEIARWAIRAVPRLPEPARATDAAITLALASMTVLNTGFDASAGLPVDAVPDDLGWVVPDAVFGRRVRLAVDVSRLGLRFRQPDDALVATDLIDLPDTRPLLLEVRWLVRGRAEHRLLVVSPDQVVPLPQEWSDLQIRTLDGARYAVAPATAVRSIGEAQRAVVLVRAGGEVGIGVQVVPGVVLTPLHVVRLAGDGPGSDETIVLQQGGRRVPAQIDVLDPSVDLATLSLTRPLNDAVIRPAPSEPAPGENVTALAVDGAGSRTVVGSAEIDALVLTLDVQGQQFKDLLEVRVTGPTDLRSGTALMRGVELVGVLAFRTGPRQFAISAGTIERFLSWALRPPEHAPDILLSDPGARWGPSEKGNRLRVERALQAARLRAWPMERLDREGSDSAALSWAQGAVCLLDQASFPTSESEREVATLAFRRWLDPEFVIVPVVARGAESMVPKSLWAIQYLIPDEVTDEELWLYLRERLDRPGGRGGAMPDESTFDATVVNALDLSRDIPPGLAAFDLDPFRSGHRSTAHTDAERADLIAMAALPSGRTLAMLAEAAAGPPGRRAVYLNAMPKEYARLLLQKAWFPAPPPPHVVIRDQNWPSDGDVSGLVGQVIDQIGGAIEADRRVTEWVLGRITMPFAVIFVTRPFPQPEIIDGLHRALPSALLFFLGSVDVSGDRARASTVSILPALPEGESMEWLHRYQGLLNRIGAPAGIEPDGGPPGSGWK